MSLNLTFEPLQPDDWPSIRQLSVAPEQSAFVGTVAELENAARPEWDYHVIRLDRDVVGFFNLDRHYPEQYAFAVAGSLGLRAFFIDQGCQGRGVGKAASLALSDHVRRRYPDCRELALTVNCRNPAAYRVYCAAGFVDHGELYHGGSAGPQYILRHPLTAQ